MNEATGRLVRSVLWAAAVGIVPWASGCGDEGGGDEDSATDTAGDDGADGDVQDEDGSGDPAEDGEADADDGDGVEESDAPTACGLPPRAFWTWDLTAMPPGDRQVPSTCRGWGDHVAVYVADDVWGLRVSESDVETIVQRWEDSTPADPARGMYEIVTGTFGEPPDVDGDPRVILFYHEVGSYMGNAFDGFFRAQDEVAGSHSNMTEMVHLDAVNNPVAQPYMLGVVAHEFQHLVHYRWDGNEDSWINEAMSEAAMVACGYYTDEGNVGAFAGNPDSPLVTTSYVDYGAEFLFGLYLWEQFGAGFVTTLVAEPGNGIAGFDAAATDEGLGVEFVQVFADWVVANHLDDTSLGTGQWGYSTYDPPAMGDTTTTPDGILRSGALGAWAADYLDYPLAGAGTDLTVHLECSGWASLGAKVVSYQTAGGIATSVTDFALDGTVTERAVAVPSGHDRATVVLYSLADGSFSYQHSALW